MNALQDFLESTTSSIGDILMLFGIVAVLLAMDWKLGLLTLLVLPALIAIRAIYLPYNKRTFRAARDASVDRQRRAGREHLRRAHGAGDAPRGDELRALRGEGARHDGDAGRTPPALAAMMTPTVSILTGVAMAIIIVVGGSEVIGATLKLGRHDRLRRLRAAVLRAGAHALDAVHRDAARHRRRQPGVRGARRAADARRQAGRRRPRRGRLRPSSSTTSPSATTRRGRC